MRFDQNRSKILVRWIFKHGLYSIEFWITTVNQVVAGVRIVMVVGRIGNQLFLFWYLILY